MYNSKIDPKDCLDIILTDIQLHVLKVRNPNSLGKQYVKAVHGSKVRRAYSNSVKPDSKNKSMELSIDLGMESLFELGRQKGKKYIRFFAKKDGLPVALGKDVMEKFQAYQKKHIKK